MKESACPAGSWAFDQEVDARGLNCPLPLLKTKKALAAMQSGQILRVQATDPGAAQDLARFAQQTGHGLLGQTQAEPTGWVFYLQCR
jgi:tRNA 2-thiouridine synthesizing protein A